MLGPSTTVFGHGTATDPFTLERPSNTGPFPVPQFRPAVVATPTFGLPVIRASEIGPFTFEQTPSNLFPSTSGQASNLFSHAQAPSLTPLSFSSLPLFGSLPVQPVAPPLRPPKIIDLISDINAKLYNRLRYMCRGKVMQIPKSNPSAKHYIREYDILKMSDASKLFFVTKRNRRLVAIRLEGSLLPEDALPLLKEESVHTLEDFLRIYGVSYGEINIFGIRVNDKPLYFAMDPRVTYEPGNFDYNRVFGVRPFSFSSVGRT